MMIGAGNTILRSSILPAAVTFGITLAAALLLASGIESAQQQAAARAVEQSAASARTAIGSELAQQTQALERLSNKWALRPQGDRLGWDLDVQQVLANYPNLLAVAWVEIEENREDFNLAWTHPPLYKSSLERLHALVLNNRKSILQNIVLSRQLTITETIHIADRGKAFAVYVPTVREGKVDGLVLGVFHLQILLDTVFEKVLLQDYSVQLADGFDVVYTRGEAKPDPGAWEHREELEILGSRFQVRIWPSPAKLDATGRVVDWVRWGGAALAVFLAGLVGLLSRPHGRPDNRETAPDMGETDSLPSWETLLSGLDEAVLLLAPSPARKRFAEDKGRMDLGQIVAASPACARLLGRDGKELAGAPLNRLLENGFAGASGFRPLDFQRTGRQQSVLRFAMRTEEALELLCSAVRLAGPGDFLLCRLQQQEEGAAVVEPGYILGASPLAAALLDKDERVIYTNPAFERLLGYGERELLRTALPFALPEKPAFRKQPVRVEVRDKSGKPFELDLFASVLGKEPGSARTLLLFADRSTERQEQEQLRKDGQRYRSMVEATSALLLLLDGEGRIAYANPAVEKNLGLAAQHLQGAPVSELLPDLDLQPGQRASVSLPTPEGSHQEFAVIVEMLEDPAQKLLTAHKANGTNSSGAAASSAHTALIEEISDLVLVLDQQLRVQWMNRAAEDFYGFARNTVHGKPWTEAWGQWLQVPGRAAIGGQVEQAGAWRGEVSSLSPQGREYVHDVVFRALADGSGYVAVWRDLTESKRALDSFRASQAAETLNSLGHKDGMVDWNLRTQEIYLSPRWKEMLGFGPGDLLDAANPWYAVVHPADLPTLRAKVAQHLGGGSEVLEADYRALHRSGEYRWMRIRGLATRNTSGEATRLVCLQSDVEEQKQSDEQLLFEAFHDSTTGLANRALLLERIAGSLGGNKPLGAVVFADLQQFAATNEMLGPAGGDAALAEAARRIAAALPEHSFLARHGSDEFAALLPPLTNGAMEELSNHIRFALAKPFSWKGKECTFDLHLGFANLEPGLKAEEQLSRASQAMAAAKQLGQPFAIYASSSPTSPAETPKACGAQEILDGIAQGEFRVFYHPVITLDTGEVAGLEALVRWQHPQRGLLAPKDFLPAAESSGAILALDRWVLREACAKAAELNTRFRRAETLVLTVNLSAQHFQASDWTSLLEDVIRNSDINPRYLRLELNSRGLHQNANLEALRENLQRVRVQVSVDDVDSTAASAENWDGLPVDRVKLLPSLVSNLAAARQREKVRGIIAEAESRGLQVVAGGVETLEQLAALRELRCHLAQGFYFAKPAPANDTERLLARSPRW